MLASHHGLAFKFAVKLIRYRLFGRGVIEKHTINYAQNDMIYCFVAL